MPDNRFTTVTAAQLEALVQHQNDPLTRFLAEDETRGVWCDEWCVWKVERGPSPDRLKISQLLSSGRGWLLHPGLYCWADAVVQKNLAAFVAIDKKTPLPEGWTRDDRGVPIKKPELEPNQFRSYFSDKVFRADVEEGGRVAVYEVKNDGYVYRYTFEEIFKMAARDRAKPDGWPRVADFLRKNHRPKGVPALASDWSIVNGCYVWRALGLKVVFIGMGDHYMTLPDGGDLVPVETQEKARAALGVE